MPKIPKRFWSSKLVFAVVGAVLLVRCSSTPRDVASEDNADAMTYSEDHIDFKKWNRTTECCTAKGTKFAVASGGVVASKAGAEANARGCNVVDAAIATTFTLAVERPQSTGIGGGGFLTLHLAKPGKDGKSDVFVDFRESAPRKATRDMFLKDGKIVENLSRDGALAAAIPGFVAGMHDLYTKYGSHKVKCQWKDLVAPAISLAENGFPAYASLVERAGIRKDVLLKDPEAARMLIPNGTAPIAEGQLLVQKDLAKTLRMIAASGKNGFYQGTIAKKIVAYMKANNGIMDETDLKDYGRKGVEFTTPMTGAFQNYTVITAPPPSGGGLALLESLNILSGFDLVNEKSRSHYIHLLAESMRRAYADRQVLGDPKFVPDLDYSKYLSTEYATKARAQINMEKATLSESIKPGHLIGDENPHTTHASLVDAQGNAVAVTTTVNFFFGNGQLVPGTGIFMNDEMDDFATQAGAQNLTGYVGTAANEIQPGKRPLSSMVPTIVLEAGKPVLVVGAAGSSTIISSVLQTLLNDLVLYKHDIHKALFAGRVHHQWKPDKLGLEAKVFSDTTQARLKKMGHILDTPKFYPQVQAVDIDPATGTMTAAHEPRDYGGAEAK